MTTERLPVTLTDDELLHRGNTLAELLDKIDSLEQQKKDSAADFKNQIETKETEASELSMVIRQKTEIREVEVRERKDYTVRKIYMVRLDTGEIYDSRPMNIDDAQEGMFEDDRHEGKIAFLGR